MFISKKVMFSKLISVAADVLIIIGQSAAQDFKHAHDGVEYARVEHKIGEDPVKIDLLRLDLKKVRIDVKMANDTVIGTETTSSIAKRHNAVAAINGGFFRLDTSEFAGEPANFLKVDGKVLSEGSNNRIVFGLKNESDRTHVFFYHPEVKFELKIGEEIVAVNGINREVKPNELVVYTHEYDRMTPLKLGCSAFSISENKVNTVSQISRIRIPEYGYVVIGCNEAMERLSNLIKKDDKVYVNSTLSSELPSSHLSHYVVKMLVKEDAVAGVSQLVKDGKIHLTWEEEKASRAFAENRHPRTAVAKMKDGKLLMVTVDGRQPGVSVGMSLRELAEYLLSIGAVDAMNLDGGGSTTMVLDGKVVNTPSGSVERKVGDALIVTLRK